jgi:integrase
MGVLTGSLAHLKPYVFIGLGAGLRPPSEIFGLRRSSVDFVRNVLRAGTKTNEDREVPMSASLRAALLELYDRDAGSDHLFVNKHTGRQMILVKNGFRKACELAGIKGPAPTRCATPSGHGSGMPATAFTRSRRRWDTVT